MIILSRQIDEEIVIKDNIVVKVVDIRGDKVRIGIQAPTEVPVHRREVFDAITRENQSSRGLDETVSRPTSIQPQKTQYQLFVERLNFGEYLEAGRIYNESSRNFEASYEELDKLSKGLYALIQSK